MFKKKIIAIILILFVAISTKSYALENKNYKVIIEDDADLLTTSEERQLYDCMQDLTEYGHILFKTVSQHSRTASSYAENFYHTKCGTESGTLFLIDMKNREIYIFSDGQNYKSITSSKAEIITDNVYKLATNKEYLKCAKEAYSQIYTVLQGGKIAEPMKYISNAFIAIMSSCLICFIIFKSLAEVKKTKLGEQTRKIEQFLDHTTPEIKKTGEHSVYSPVDTGSSGGGGGFSGGGSSGGGSSGGGGGHSF